MTSTAADERAVHVAGVATWLRVGLEIHLELATRAKMFSPAPNAAHPDNWDAAPNTLCDPIVLGMPGALPKANEHAIEMAARVGLALGCELPDTTKWDRKSYYYPDLPKNYQISQYDAPLCGAGSADFPAGEGVDPPRRPVRIRRAHLEEDAGKLMHEAPGGKPIDHSIVDFNRAGTPLLEIVTEPDITSPEQAVAFGQWLRSTCRHLGVSEAVMQRGQMRFEPNINVTIEKEGVLHETPIVEIKNLNSFRALEAAIAYEHRRQVEAFLETGAANRPGAKETRGWDDDRGVSLRQREKEEAHDYRYFPDPDLVPVRITRAWRERLEADMPELPLARRDRYVRELGVEPEHAQALIADAALTAFFESAVGTGARPPRAAALLLNEGAKRANERSVSVANLGVGPEQLRDIGDMLESEKIGSSGADKLFGLCMESDADAAALAEENGLLQVSDAGALEQYVEEVVADPANAKAVADVAAGKDKAIGALMGAIMKRSQGQANPKVVTELIKKRLRSE